MMWLLAILIVQPVFDEAGTMRLVSDADVEWSVDGEVVGATLAHESLELPVAAGTHEVVGASDTSDEWTILARSTGHTEGATYVPAWTAQATATGGNSAWPQWTALAAGVGLVMISRRRSLQ